MNHHANARLALPLALPLALALLLAGCGGGGSNGGSSSSPSPAPVTPAAPLSASAVTPSGLTATLAQNTAIVASGGSVTYTLTLANTTTRSFSYTAYSGDGQVLSGTAHFQIVDSSGNTVPYMLSGPIGGGSSPASLAVGQTLTDTVTVGTSFPGPGRYSATATFASLTTPNQPATLGPLEVDVQ